MRRSPTRLCEAFLGWKVKVRLSTSMQIDCVAGTAVIEVSAVVPDDGQDELDLRLMDAMAAALTLMGQATRREQRKIAHGEDEDEPTMVTAP